MPRRWHCRPGGLGGAGSAHEKVALQAWRTRGGGQAVPRRRWHCRPGGLVGAGCAHKVALRASRLPRVVLSQG